jgi:anaerobic selenocysteine-containing dehydrogenase
MSNDEGTRRVRTFCKVCEPACGLIALVENDELVGLEPDREHPVSRGFACHKGLAGDEIHRDPDRVDHPLRRNEAGDFERVSWDEAIEEIATRMRALIDGHGPDCIAPYIGNPTAFNALVGPAIGGLFAQLGVRRFFSSGTQDCANKFAGSEAVFGSSTMHPIPDLAHTDFFLSFGSNPRVSHASFISMADPIAEIKGAIKRGARVVHVNPRRIESEKTKAGETLQIAPDSDLYLLAAMICEIDRSVGFAEDVVAEHGKHVDALRRFVGAYPPERVASVTGIEAEAIRDLACDFAGAKSAAIHMSTGVNMGRQGTLAYWLLHMLSFVTGNLDRRGGNILSVGFYNSAKAGRRRFNDSLGETEFGLLRRGGLPGNLLGEYITLEENPVRALFSVAGNPVLSIGGESRLRDAFDRLELVVVIDFYRNATAEYADFILPATDGFERPDINITGLGLQYQPYIQFSDPVVPARGERREEWWILGRIAQALGLSSPFDEDDEELRRTNLWARTDHMLADRELRLDDVRAEPHGIVFEEGLSPGEFYSRHLQTDDRKVDCCPPGFAPALERAAEIFAQLESEDPGQLKLISLRDPYMHNTWYANLERMKRGSKDRNYLHLHPDEASTRGLHDGQKVRVSNANGSVEVELKCDPDFKRGVVGLTHGWGNVDTPGMRVAQRTAGVNPNALLPSGPGSFEPLSSQAFMTGIPVAISPL